MIDISSVENCFSDTNCVLSSTLMLERFSNGGRGQSLNSVVRQKKYSDRPNAYHALHSLLQCKGWRSGNIDIALDVYLLGKRSEEFPSWMHVSFDYLEDFSSAIYFLDENGFLYYLPAFMHRYVENSCAFWGGDAFDVWLHALDCSGEKECFFSRFYTGLDNKKRLLISDFLLFMARNDQAPISAEDRSHIFNLAINYWGKSC